MTGARDGAFSVNVNFTTFGMFIVDEIEWQPPNPPPPKYGLIGGAGTYAILGARLVSGRQLARSISWIVDVGSDFPPRARESIDSWNTDCVYRYDPERQTTRAWNGYGPNDFRAFKYLTAKKRLEVTSLNAAQLMSKGFHMVCSPERSLSITTNLQSARRQIDPAVDQPIVIWEPIPDLCSPAELLNLQKAAQNCTIISPNHEELRMFFDGAMRQPQADLVASFMGWDKSSSSACTRDSYPSLMSIPVIREGAQGSTAYFHYPVRDGGESRVISIHLNAYHDVSTRSAVIDPTGGGNTYLGALGMALTGSLDALPTTHLMTEMLGLQPQADRSEEHEEEKDITFKTCIHRTVIAMVYATLAASFAIEQNGVPVISCVSEDRASTSERERWNGDSVMDRLQTYLQREAAAIRKQLRSVTV